MPITWAVNRPSQACVVICWWAEILSWEDPILHIARKCIAYPGRVWLIFWASCAKAAASQRVLESQVPCSEHAQNMYSPEAFLIYLLSLILEPWICVVYEQEARTEDGGWCRETQFLYSSLLGIIQHEALTRMELKVQILENSLVWHQDVLRFLPTCNPVSITLVTYFHRLMEQP